MSQDRPQDPSDTAIYDIRLREDPRLSSRQLGKPHPDEREAAFTDGFDNRKERPRGVSFCGKRSPRQTPGGFLNWLKHKRELMGSGTKWPDMVEGWVEGSHS